MDTPGKRKHIAVLWWFDKASWVWPNWRDGYRAAWEEIAKEHDVTWFLDKKMPTNDGTWDHINLWDDSNSSFFQFIDEYPCTKSLSLTTAPQNWDNLKKVNVVFAESDIVYDMIRPRGIHVIKAFGTDTNFYHPNLNVDKDIEFFYPATFSPWKRQNEIAYLGNKLVCIGTVQPDGVEILEECRSRGVQIEVGYFPAEKIRRYYWRTKKCMIPAVHGSERTVLECMSMNIPVEVSNSWNHKAASYMKEFEKTNFETTRDFILDRYSEKTFAAALMKGINA